MERFRRLVAIGAAAAVLLLAPVRAAETPGAKLKLVSTVWPPFTDLEARPRVATDLVHEALKRAGVEAETAIVADNRLEPAIRDGSYAGSGALWYSEQRAEFLLYSEPYMENRLVLVGKKGSDVSAASFTELQGKRIALVEGYAYGPEVDAVRKDSNGPKFVPGKALEQNLRQVLDGAVDYTLIDQLVIRYIVKQYRESALASLEIGTTPLVKRPLHLAVRKDVPGAEAIVQRFNQQIDAMLADGTYNQTLGLAWIQTDVDGDGQPELVLRGERAGTAPPTDAYQVRSIDAALRDHKKKVRFLIGKELYDDWKAVPERYKVALPPTDLTPERDAVPLFKIRF